jgi:hypothetical protein
MPVVSGWYGNYTNLLTSTIQLCIFVDVTLTRPGEGLFIYGKRGDYFRTGGIQESG